MYALVSNCISSFNIQLILISEHCVNFFQGGIGNLTLRSLGVKLPMIITKSYSIIMSKIDKYIASQLNKYEDKYKYREEIPLDPEEDLYIDIASPSVDIYDSINIEYDDEGNS